MYNFPIFSESFLSSLDQETLLRLVEYKKKFDKGEKLPQESNELLGRCIPDWIFDKDYIFKAIVPAIFTNINEGAKLTLPLLDKEVLDKQDAIPYFLWGLFYESWKPTPEEGTTVFVTGFQNQQKNEGTIRGKNNEKKKIYYSALTPDLFEDCYKHKVVDFWDKLLHSNNADQALMGLYLDEYFKLYWNLHLGLDNIPQYIVEVGNAFMNVIGYIGDPLQDIVYNSYMDVRSKRDKLKQWIEGELNNAKNDKKTFVYYWLKNSESKDYKQYFSKQDIVFECFHNFLAFSQWGNTIYNIIKIFVDGNDGIKEKFKEIMDADNREIPDEKGFCPLDYFVMELFRWISPNAGSISNIEDNKILEIPRSYGGINLYNYHVTPHKATSDYEIHWENPKKFDPDRYKKENVLTSDQVDIEKSKEIGFAQCPFHNQDFPVTDGRPNTQIQNSAFGTVYNAVGEIQYPVIDYAGYAPFGFGYRRCPGELFTVYVIKKFLEKVWENPIEFKLLDQGDWGPDVPLGPNTVVPDKYGFEG